MGIIETIGLILMALLGGGYWADRNRKKIEDGKRDSDRIDAIVKKQDIENEVDSTERDALNDELRES